MRTEFTSKAIPESPRTITALDYMGIPFDPSHYQADEPLVDALTHGLAGENYYARTDGDNVPYHQAIPGAIPQIYLRRPLIEKLLKVNEDLKSYGLEVYLLDGYRPIEVQRAMWDFFIEQGRRTLRNPTEQALVDYAGTYASDPRRFDPANNQTWPIHTTGGSVDVTLRRIGGLALDMGGHFDDPTAVSHTTHFEKAAHGNPEARDNRRLLYHAMAKHGLTNYMHEWWHFDYGTQMWALVKTLETGTAHKAIFGYTEPHNL